jgi:hypothetical protein
MAPLDAAAGPPKEPVDTDCAVLVELLLVVEVCEEAAEWPLAGMVWVAVAP